MTKPGRRFSARSSYARTRRGSASPIGDSFQKIREGKGLNPEEEALVRQARAKIIEHRHITLANADRFLELYRRNWEGAGSRLAGWLRATNNRFGYYPPKTIDVYYDAVPITEQLVRTAVSRSKEAVLEIVRGVRNTSPPESDLRELLAVLETRIDSSFENMVREVRALHADLLARHRPCPAGPQQCVLGERPEAIRSGTGFPRRRVEHVRRCDGRPRDRSD